MKFFTKYALAAALVIPSAFAFTANEADAASVVINKNRANGVNVRSEAKLGDNIVGLIDDADKEYKIKDKKDGWFQIDFDGKDAFVSGELFHLLEETHVVSATNFRKEPNLNSEIYEVLEKETMVKAIELAENGFVKVEVDGKEGYIYNNLLKTFRDRNEAYAAKNNQVSTPSQSYNQQTQAPARQQTQAPARQQSQQQTQQQAPVQQNQQAPAQNNNQSYQGSSNWAKEWIAQRESNGSYNAYNPNGGYYGRYQLNPSLVPYGASPAQQEAAADNYVAQRYGSWENAQAFWQRNGWY
ncbi:SH3 domain-containing protein [uncultured Anaerococcus sp.]|uniref:aggregation-promoting factor C-terminal-like domain-containing protein n=1 Tax=uncultured Anaerococcus sp. TaxID=293428 RepID=UPI0026005F5D|nr:SH3 domain-containing protein [uncultured Anaerococcus sp.]